MLMMLAPILHALDLNISQKIFNGRLRDHDSIWRKAPSPQVDAAWDRISTEGLELIGVSRDEIINSGKNPSQCVQTPPSWDEYSKERPFIAQIEVFHEIHCLDELRKEVFADHYYKGRERNESRTSHITHCIHMILQSLMCSADVGIITHNWIHNELFPTDPKTRVFADFNSVKKCRDFDSILDWAQKHGLKKTTANFGNLKWEPGMEIVPGDGYGPETHPQSSSNALAHEGQDSGLQ